MPVTNSISLNLKKGPIKGQQSFLGGFPSLGPKEEVPPCRYCGVHMHHLLTLDFESLPFRGWGPSSGRNLLFICLDSDCSSFREHQEISYASMESSASPSKLQLIEHEGSTIPEHSIVRVGSANSPLGDLDFILKEKDHNRYSFELNMVNYVRLKFVTLTESGEELNCRLTKVRVSYSSDEEPEVEFVTRVIKPSSKESKKPKKSARKNSDSTEPRSRPRKRTPPRERASSQERASSRERSPQERSPSGGRTPQERSPSRERASSRGRSPQGRSPSRKEVEAEPTVEAAKTVEAPQTAPTRVRRSQVPSDQKSAARSGRPSRGRQSRSVQSSEPPEPRYAEGRDPVLKDWNKVASKKREASPSREAPVESKKSSSSKKKSETPTAESETPVAGSRVIRKPRSYTTQPRLPISPPKEEDGYVPVENIRSKKREARSLKKATRKEWKERKEYWEQNIKPRIEAEKKAQEEAAAAKAETKSESPANKTPKNRTPKNRSPKPVVPEPAVEPSENASAE
jgi:hypothetical protein